MTPAATPSRPPARTAAEVAAGVPLSAPAQALLAPGQTARQFFDALVAAPLAEDAIRFLAAALPKREAVWWGVLCARDTAGTPAARKAVAAAEAWVKDPSEANRRAAEAAANAAGHDTPPGTVAAAAFYSAGSLAPPNLPPAPPPDDLTGKAVAGAVLLAAVADPPKADAARARFLALGSDVAAGKVKW
jgi:hypothetical protein